MFSERRKELETIPHCFLDASVSTVYICNRKGTQESSNWLTHRVGLSAKLFLQSSALELPHPLSRSRSPPPFGPGGRHTGTLACGRGFGGVPIPTRGHTLWCSVYICTLWTDYSTKLTFLYSHTSESLHPERVHLLWLYLRITDYIIEHPVVSLKMTRCIFLHENSKWARHS